MKIFYLDNFRGFNNQFTEIYNVNFLVGENSTGKTSFISALKVISDREFWFNNPDFVTDQVILGNFEDIVNINNKNNKSFTIGLHEKVPYVDFRKKKKIKKETEYESFALSFKNKYGSPFINLYSFIFEDEKVVHLRFESDATYLKSEKIPHNLNEKEIFQFLIESHKEITSKKGFAKLDNRIFAFNPGSSNLLLSRAIAESSFDMNQKLDSMSKRLSKRSTDITWVAPLRAKPSKTYDQYKSKYSPEGDHIPYVLKESMIDNPSSKKSKKLQEMIKTFGIESGLYKEVQVKTLGSKSKSPPFEIDIILDSKPIRISNVGYGVAQVLPVIIESFKTIHSSIAIQQPEVHLHPKAQAALGKFFYNLSNDKDFLIETHSDFLIDNFRYQMRGDQETDNKCKAQILFFERCSEGNKITSIDIDKNGDIKSPPKSYRDFFIDESIKMLGLE